MKRRSSIASSLALLFLLIILGFAWFNRNDIYDWFRLRSYQPNSHVVRLAKNDTMTPNAKRMFYINHPSIEDKASFNNNCPNDGGEQTIILGCYHGSQTGIYLYSVSDPKLNGVEEVTAAHETLHAVYDRLSPEDKNYVDNLLTNYYKNDLHDKRILATIATYQKTEPNDVVNEMHSIFGTEVDNLPTALENYYKQYFTNRHKVVGYARRYQKAFTDNQSQASKYYAQIKNIEKQLGGIKLQIDAQETALITESRQLDAERHNVDPNSFNAGVRQYNAKVGTYKALLNQYNSLIDQHNQLIAKYLALNTETNQLFKELDSRSASVAAQ
jgi:hypothetical protein